MFVLITELRHGGRWSINLVTKEQCQREIEDDTQVVYCFELIDTLHGLITINVQDYDCLEINKLNDVDTPTDESATFNIDELRNKECVFD